MAKKPRVPNHRSRVATLWLRTHSKGRLGQHIINCLLSWVPKHRGELLVELIAFLIGDRRVVNAKFTPYGCDHPVSRVSIINIDAYSPLPSLLGASSPSSRTSIASSIALCIASMPALAVSSFETKLRSRLNLLIAIQVVYKKWMPIQKRAYKQL